MTDENQETMTAAIKSAVLDAIDTRDRENSKRDQQAKAQELSVERAAKKFLSIRDIVLTIGFFVTLIGGATISVTQLREKPSKIEVAAAIDAQVDPLALRVSPIEHSVAMLEANVERIQKIQEIQLIHSEWRAKVSDCRARASCKRAPGKPPELEQKKLELMTQRAR